MDDKLAKEIFDIKPEWFRDRCSISVGDGWFNILRILVGHLKDVVKDQKFSITTIKEKFGGLRFYVSAVEGEREFDKVNCLIMFAESMSFVTCEYCGRPGKPRSGSWVKTLCDDCLEKKRP